MARPTLIPRPMTQEDAVVVCHLFNDSLRDAGDYTEYSIDQISSQIMTDRSQAHNAMMLLDKDRKAVGFVMLSIEEGTETLRGELRFDLSPPHRSEEELNDLMGLLLDLEQTFLQQVKAGRFLREVVMFTHIIGDAPWKERIIQRLGFGSKHFTSELEYNYHPNVPLPSKEEISASLAEKNTDLIPCPQDIRFETIERLWSAVFGGLFDYEQLTKSRWERQRQAGQPFHPDNLYILRYDKQWAGLFSLSPHPLRHKNQDVTLIHELGIHPGLRKKGLGGLLIDFALAEAKERYKPDAVRLYVATASGHLSRNLYQRRGFSRRQVIVTHLKRLR